MEGLSVETNDEIKFGLRFGEDHLALTLQPSFSARHVAVLIHGGPGGSQDGPDGLYSDLARHLQTLNIASVRFDFLGAGESSGRYRDMTIANQALQLDHVLRAVQGMGFRHVSAIAESFGATALLAGNREGVERLVLLWPAIDLLDKCFASYVTPEQFEKARLHGFITEEGDEVGLGFLEELLRVRTVAPDLATITVPTLLVHGLEDSEVPYQQSERAAATLGDLARLVLIPGADHCAPGPEARSAVYDEVRNWLSPWTLPGAQ